MDSTAGNVLSLSQRKGAPTLNEQFRFHDKTCVIFHYSLFDFWCKKSGMNDLRFLLLSQLYKVENRRFLNFSLSLPFLVNWDFEWILHWSIQKCAFLIIKRVYLKKIRKASEFDSFCDNFAKIREKGKEIYPTSKELIIRKRQIIRVLLHSWESVHLKTLPIFPFLSWQREASLDNSNGKSSDSFRFFQSHFQTEFFCSNVSSHIQGIFLNCSEKLRQETNLT